MKDFNEALFLSKVNNVFVKFFTAIMLDELNTIDHFVSDEVYEYGEDILNINKNAGYTKMYDMINVKSSKITNIEETEKEYIIDVFVESRYLDYRINNEDGSIEGDNKDRVQVDYNLTFKKNKNAEESDIVKKCPGCGRSIDVNDSGACEYCGAIYNQEDFDWVLTNIEEN